MTRLVKLIAVLISALALLCLIGYEIFVHSQLDESISFIERTVAARTPTGLTGMVPLSKDFEPVADTDPNWTRRPTEEKQRLTTTWLHGLAMAQNSGTLTEGITLLSTDLPLPSTNDWRRDAWGRPFCVMRAHGSVTIVSAGLTRDSVPNCAKYSPTTEQVRRLHPTKMYMLSSGYLLLIVEAAPR